MRVPDSRLNQALQHMNRLGGASRRGKRAERIGPNP
jgi:hypothetical protein